MNVVGKLVTTHDHVAGGAVQKWRLVKVAPPLRLRDFVTGQYADGWTGATSAYTRFSTGEAGRVRIVVSRPWGGVDVEAEAQQHPRASGARSSASSTPRAGRGSEKRLRSEERAQLEPVEPGGVQVARTSSRRYCRGLRSKTSFFSRVAGDARRRLAVARVVDRAEDRRRRDRLGRLVVVEVAEHDVAAASPRGAIISGLASTPR
jgi:hypothetical protein